MRNAIYIIPVMVFTIFVNAFGQRPVVELTFTAVNNVQYVPLDSILIENLTQGGDTTLYAPDTVLVLDYVISSISDNDGIEGNSFFVSQNYPNPFKGQTSVNLYLVKKEHIEISIVDILGREVVRYENNLNSGNHLFTFYPGKEKYYLFTAKGNSLTKTIKMVNINSHSETQNKIVYNGYSDNAINYKSHMAINSFIFTLGDQLRYIGYANTVNGINGSNVIEDAPQTNEIYEFEITEGIPCPGIPNVIYMGRIYNTVQIGDQCWIKENLNARFMINESQNQSDNGIIEKYCYNNSMDSCVKYGGLYQWDEMMNYNTTNGSQGICPDGWYIPTCDDWEILENYVGGSAIAGKKLKSRFGWYQGGNGTDEYGFTVLPAGYLDYAGTFYSLFHHGYLWSSTENSSWGAGTIVFVHSWDKTLLYTDEKIFAYSFRCIKD